MPNTQLPEVPPFTVVEGEIASASTPATDHPTESGCATAREFREPPARKRKCDSGDGPASRRAHPRTSDTRHLEIADPRPQTSFQEHLDDGRRCWWHAVLDPETGNIDRRWEREFLHLRDEFFADLMGRN